MIKQHSNTLLTCICIAVIALITWLVFSPSLNDWFTNWDDNYYVANNPLVVNNSVPVVKIFETPVSFHYHPLTVLSLALNYRFGKLDPYGYHLVNVLFHVLNTILVFLFIFLLTSRNVLMAAIVSLFFGIHPMHVESVAWVSERKDVLYVFFFMAGLITYLRYSDTKKRAWYFFTLLLFILSCLSKEMAIVFPFILLLIDYLNGAAWGRRLFIEKIPFFLLAVVLGIVEIKIQTGNGFPDMKNFTFFQRLLFASYAAVIYIVKLFAPYKLSAFYPYPNTNNPLPLIFYFSPFILIGILCTLIYFFLKKKKEIVFGLLFYFVSVVLVLQFIPVNPGIMPDRYSYISYIGLLFIVAYIFNKAWKSKKSVLMALKYPFAIILGISTVVFSFQTYARSQVWKNSITLWTNVIDNYPDTFMAYYDLALYYYSVNDAKNEMPYLNKAIKSDSNYAYAYVSRGLLYFNDDKYDSALSDDNKAIELDSTLADAYNDRGLVYDYYNKNNLALSDLNKAVAIDDTFKTAYNNRAMLYNKYGNYNSAIADFTKVTALDSADAITYYYRGTVYYNTNRYDLALADYNKAITLNPANAFYYYCRGLCYNALELYKQAVDDFTTGIELNPKNVEVYYSSRGKCNFYLQRYIEAIDDFSNAIEINPTFADYWLNRSLVENKIGQSENAKADELKGKQLQAR